MNKTTNKFSPEVRERAVRLVLDNEAQHPSRWQAVMSIAAKIGCTPQTLNDWVKKAEVDSGRRAGVPTEMAEGPCAVIGGGVGLAIAFPVAKHLVETGHEVHAIMGARTKDLLLMEDQFRELLDEDHIHITTDDGSYGEQGVVTAPLERLLQDKAVSQVFCVGPVPMMKFSTLTAQKYDTPITASLNPIMVDGTGMCGCCRVEVGGVTKFACVDGPDFDATLVDWDDLRARQAAYRSEEGESLKAYEEKSCACH